MLFGLCYHHTQEEEKAKATAAEAEAEAQRAEIAARTAQRRADLSQLRLKKDPRDMPEAVRRHHAVREKQKYVG